MVVDVYTGLKIRDVEDMPVRLTEYSCLVVLIILLVAIKLFTKSFARLQSNY